MQMCTDSVLFINQVQLFCLDYKSNKKVMYFIATDNMVVKLSITIFTDI